MSQISNETLSINKYLWQIKKCEDRDILFVQQQTNLNETISRILLNKNIPLEEISDHLSPTLKRYLPDPLHFLDMEKAGSRIAKAIALHQKIVVFGDYDVDGATSSALFKRFFDLCKATSQIYIPDRINEGYGPNKDVFSNFKKEKVDLVITVDCGTTSFEAIDFAHEIGLDTIIVDHHISGETLPKAFALVNPNRIDEQTTYTKLAAVGVAFMVLVATLTMLKKANYFSDTTPPNLLELLDLVAVGTICDVVPLDNLNRAFVIQGLKILSKRTNIGLSALFDISGLYEFPNSYHLGYILGPKINAGGRIGESKLGSELLSTMDKDVALGIAEKLNILNQERRAIENFILEEAIKLAEEESLSSVLFIIGKDWHPGVIGIIASRLKERYNKPTAVITLVDGIGKASCRSIIGIDFGSAIINAKLMGIVETGGGHAMAAGFTAKEENLSKIKEYLENRFKDKLADFNANVTRYFDNYLSASGINEELAKDIERLGPFGPDNTEPRFYITDFSIVKASIVAESHINFYIKPNSSLKSKTIKGIIFRAADNKDIVEEFMKPLNSNLAIIGTIKINKWQGIERVELVVIDIIRL